MTYKELYDFIRRMADRSRDVYDITQDEKMLFHFSDSVGALSVVSSVIHPWYH